MSEVSCYPSQKWLWENKNEGQGYIATCFDNIYLFKLLTCIKDLREYRTMQGRGKGQILKTCNQKVFIYYANEMRHRKLSDTLRSLKACKLPFHQGKFTFYYWKKWTDHLPWPG
jgi:hypothetical protein